MQRRLNTENHDVIRRSGAIITMEHHDEPYYQYPASSNEEEFGSYYAPIRSPQHYGAEEDKPLNQVLNFVKGNNFAFVVAIFVIALFQFQGPVLRWYRGHMGLIRAGNENVSVIGILYDLFIGCIVSLLDYARAAYQIFAEWTSRDRKREKRRNRCNSLPELEDCGTAKFSSVAVEELLAGEQQQHQTLRRNESPKEQEWVWETRELEPTFLKESDYPANWKVYHRDLGVVLKTEADRYEKEQADKQRINGEEEQRLKQQPRPKSDDVEEEEEKKCDSASSISLASSRENWKDARIGPERSPQQSPEKNQNSLPVLRSAVAT